MTNGQREKKWSCETPRGVVVGGWVLPSHRPNDYDLFFLWFLVFLSPALTTYVNYQLPYRRPNILFSILYHSLSIPSATLC